MGSRILGKAPLRRAIAVLRRESRRESLESGNGSLQMIEVEVELEGRRFDEEERLAVEGMTLEDDVGTLDEEDDIDYNYVI